MASPSPGNRLRAWRALPPSPAGERRPTGLALADGRPERGHETAERSRRRSRARAVTARAVRGWPRRAVEHATAKTPGASRSDAPQARHPLNYVRTVIAPAWRGADGLARRLRSAMHLPEGPQAHNAHYANAPRSGALAPEVSAFA